LLSLFGSNDRKRRVSVHGTIRKGEDEVKVKQTRYRPGVAQRVPGI
jgi:hypothetical protein